MYWLSVSDSPVTKGGKAPSVDCLSRRMHTATGEGRIILAHTFSELSEKLSFLRKEVSKKRAISEEKMNSEGCVYMSPSVSPRVH